MLILRKYAGYILQKLFYKMFNWSLWVLFTAIMPILLY